MQRKEFLIGLSFPSNHRRLARSIATCLGEKIGKDNVFFDEWYENRLRGKDFDTRLEKIYREQCEMVVPIFSEHYRTCWCKIEWSAMRSLLLGGASPQQVIPIHLDGTKIDGWPETDLGIRKKRLNASKLALKLLGIIEHRGLQSDHQDTEIIESSLEKTIGQTEESLVRDVAEKYEASDAAFTRGAEAKGNFGFIIVADVFDSSSLPARSLREVVCQLWQFPEYFEKVFTRFPRMASGILDGLILAIPSSADGLVFEKVLASCMEWVHRMEVEANAPLRIAIHLGVFDWLSDPPLLIGSDPNECSRLVRIAGEGQVLLSEPFVQAWRRELGEEAVRDVMPPINEQPWEFEQKPGTSSRVRLYAKAGLQSSPPSIQRKISEAEKAIQLVLGQVNAELVDNLTELDPSISAVKIKARISIFCPRPEGGGVLVPTKFRFMAYRERRNPVPSQKGVTTYSIQVGKPPHGTVGRAFAERTWQVLAHLPIGHSKKYHELLTSEPWNLPEQTIRNFGRRARAFIAFPFSLTEKATDPEGVVCIDTMNSLSGVSLEELDLIAEFLSERFGTSLAALWRVRR